MNGCLSSLSCVFCEGLGCEDEGECLGVDRIGGCVGWRGVGEDSQTFGEIDE